MANNPYSYTDIYHQVPEYNVRGDSGNGMTGSYSPQAIQNRNAQPPVTKGNPYADVLNYLPKRPVEGGTPPAQQPIPPRTWAGYGMNPPVQQVPPPAQPPIQNVPPPQPGPGPIPQTTGAGYGPPMPMTAPPQLGTVPFPPPTPYESHPFPFMSQTGPDSLLMALRHMGARV